jgi:hypothetical protein
MPKFENTLPDESRWNVVNYLRTLMAVPATAPSTESSTKPKISQDYTSVVTLNA